jgi:hypothetical protein
MREFGRSPSLYAKEVEKEGIYAQLCSNYAIVIPL